MIIVDDAGVVVQWCAISARLQTDLWCSKLRQLVDILQSMIGYNSGLKANIILLENTAWMLLIYGSRTGCITWMTCKFVVKERWITPSVLQTSQEIATQTIYLGVGPVCLGRSQVRCMVKLALISPTFEKHTAINGINSERLSLENTEDRQFFLQSAVVWHHWRQ